MSWRSSRRHCDRTHSATDAPDLQCNQGAGDGALIAKRRFAILTLRCASSRKGHCTPRLESGQVTSYVDMPIDRAAAELAEELAGFDVATLTVDVMIGGGNVFPAGDRPTRRKLAVSQDGDLLAIIDVQELPAGVVVAVVDVPHEPGTLEAGAIEDAKEQLGRMVDRWVKLWAKEKPQTSPQTEEKSATEEKSQPETAPQTEEKPQTAPQTEEKPAPMVVDSNPLGLSGDLLTYAHLRANGMKSDDVARMLEKSPETMADYSREVSQRTKERLGAAAPRRFESGGIPRRLKAMGYGGKNSP